MNAVNFRLRSRVRGVAPLMLAGLVFPVFAGEPAKISVPSVPANSSNLARPAEPFQPIDRGSSVGGVVDTPAAPPVGTVEPPDARTQKAIFERLDRQKNWLLDDPTDPKSTSSFREPGTDDESAYGTNPGKPKTALERRLRSGSQTDTTRSAGNAAERQANQPSDADRGPLAPDNPTSAATANPAFGSNLEGVRNFNVSRSSALFVPAPEPGLMEGIRSSRTTLDRQNTGFDNFGSDRMERFQKSFGEGALAPRNPFADNAGGVSRSRESRADSFNSLLGTSPQTALAAVGGEPADAAALLRSGLGDSSRLGGSPSPYAPSAPVATPALSPAAQLLKAPPVQAPKFRP